MNRKRIAEIIRNDIESLVANADNQNAHLDWLVLEIADLLNEVTEEAKLAIVNEKRLVKLVEKEAATTTEWQSRADWVESEGHKDLARKAESKRDEHAHMRDELECELQKHSAAAEKMKTVHRVLTERLEQARAKKSELSGRIEPNEADAIVNVSTADSERAVKHNSDEDPCFEHGHDDSACQRSRIETGNTGSERLVQDKPDLPESDNKGASGSAVALQSRVGHTDAALAAQRSVAVASADDDGQNELAAALARMEAEEAEAQRRGR